MDHIETAEIARYLRGQLSAERALEVERHLVICRECAERISSESLSMTQVPSLPVMGPPEEVRESKAVAESSHRSASVSQRSEPEQGQEDSLPGRGDQLGRYLILERVGRGGMGVVYAAWDPDLGRRVAIKLLRTDKKSHEAQATGQARLLREAQAMARVSHPNVISVFDVGTLGEGVFVAMEFVDGGTLRSWIKEKPRAWREVLDVFLAAGRGLAGAHAAGLVHRDFKPDNVLLGKDGRVRVTDFGLARLAEEEQEKAPAARPELPGVNESPELAQLTQDGLVVGTPRFMAPEQLRIGATPDARSDQFSFCVALYHALYGEWPFEKPHSVARLVEHSPSSSPKGTSRPSQRDGDSRPVNAATGAFEPPRDSKVPGFVRSALMRGLSPDPEERFSSMEALLAQLENRPRKAWVGAAAATALMVLGVGGYFWSTHLEAQRQAQLCTGSEQKLAGLWDEAARRQVTEALVATGKPTAADVASRATRMLDDYARGWVEASTEACRATRLRGEQTEQLLSLRVLCLERRLKDVKAVTGVLTSADAELVDKAMDAVSLLPSLRACEDVTSLSQVEPPPDSPQIREGIERISSQVAQIKALTDAGRYKQAMDIAGPTLETATALGYRPLTAEALLWMGTLEARRLEPAAAEQHLLQALWAALTSRNDEVQARATTMLVFVVASDAKRFNEALQWGEMAKATLARMGGSEDIESDLFRNLGNAYAGQRRHTDSLAAYAQALQLAEKASGPEHVRRSLILGNMGAIMKRDRRFDEASRALTEAVGIRERVSGPNHPLGGVLHYSLAQTFLLMKDFQKAQVHAQRALEIYLAAFGPEHSKVADTYDVVGTIYLDDKKYREALEPFQKALAIKEKTLGKNHEDVSYSASGLARSLLGLGEAARAMPLFERVLALKPSDPWVHGDAALGLARALEAQKRDPARALELARTARAVFAADKATAGVEEVDAWLAKYSVSKTPSKKRRSR
jgi:tetratricopeptide (TPR) repeat protein